MTEEDVRTLFPWDMNMIEGLSADFLEKLNKFWKNFDNKWSNLSGVLHAYGLSLGAFAN